MLAFLGSMRTRISPIIEMLLYHDFMDCTRRQLHNMNMLNEYDTAVRQCLRNEHAEVMYGDIKSDDLYWMSLKQAYLVHFSDSQLISNWSPTSLFTN